MACLPRNVNIWKIPNEWKIYLIDNLKNEEKAENAYLCIF